MKSHPFFLLTNWAPLREGKGAHRSRTKASCLEYRLSGLDGGWKSAPSNRCGVSEHRWVLNVYPQPQSLSRVPNPYLEFPFRYFHLKSNRHLKCIWYVQNWIHLFSFFVQTYTFSSAPSLTELLSHFPYLLSLQSWKFLLIPFSAAHLYCCWLLTDSQLLHTDCCNSLFSLVFLPPSLSPYFSSSFRPLPKLTF